MKITNRFNHMNYRINCKWWFAKYSSSISTCPIYHVAKEKWWILQRKKPALLLLKPITFKGCLSCIAAKGNRVERCTMLAKLSGKYQKMCILLWNAILVILRVNPVYVMRDSFSMTIHQTENISWTVYKTFHESL